MLYFFFHGRLSVCALDGTTTQVAVTPPPHPLHTAVGVDNGCGDLWQRNTPFGCTDVDTM